MLCCHCVLLECLFYEPRFPLFSCYLLCFKETRGLGLKNWQCNLQRVLISVWMRLTVLLVWLRESSCFLFSVWSKDGEVWLKGHLQFFSG